MRYIIILVLLAFAGIGCTKQLKTFDGKPVVYFQYAVEPKDPNNPEIFWDSTIISFAYSPATSKDSVITLMVKSTGSPATVNRQYAIKVNDSSTAKEGVHYDFVNTDYTIQAGKVIDTIYLKLHRLPQMASQSFNIYFELQPNDNFGVDIEVKHPTNSTASINTIRHRVKIDDILAQPKYWLDAYLGTFTRKKLYLMAEVIGFQINVFNTTISVADLVFYGKFMQRYLNEQRGLGNIIKEDNGTDMVMGALSQ